MICPNCAKANIYGHSPHLWSPQTSLSIGRSTNNRVLDPFLEGAYQVIKYIGFNAVNLVAAYCVVKTIRSDPGRVPLVWDFTKAQSRKYCLLCHNFKVQNHPLFKARSVSSLFHLWEVCPQHGPSLSLVGQLYWLLQSQNLHALSHIWLDHADDRHWVELQQTDRLSVADERWVGGDLRASHGVHTDDVWDGHLFPKVRLPIFSIERFHLSLMINNMTTIEHLEKKRALFPDNSSNKYDKGCLINW